MSWTTALGSWDICIFSHAKAPFTWRTPSEVLSLFLNFRSCLLSYFVNDYLLMKTIENWAFYSPNWLPKLNWNLSVCMMQIVWAAKFKGSFRRLACAILHETWKILIQKGLFSRAEEFDMDKVILMKYQLKSPRVISKFSNCCKDAWKKFKFQRESNLCLSD